MAAKLYYFRLLITGLVLAAAWLAGSLFFKVWIFSELRPPIFLKNLSASQTSRPSDPGQTVLNSAVIKQPETVLPEPPINFLFFGDLMLDRQVGNKLKNHSLAYLFGPLASSSPDFFAGHDLISANLEGAVTNQGQHYQPLQAYDFAFKPETVEELKKYGFNFFNLANNHITDQGARGLSETRANLSRLGFNYSGGADAAADQSALKVIKLKNQTIAFLGFSMVYHDFNLTKAKELVSQAKTKADLVIINIHWGKEYQHKFSQHQQVIGQALIEAGADIIIGHHPHVVQGLEIYQGKPIFYSLGNFIFDQYFSADTQQGLAISLDLSTDKLKILLSPLQAKSSVPQLITGVDKISFLNKYISWSQVDASLQEPILQGQIDLPWPAPVDKLKVE